MAASASAWDLKIATFASFLVIYLGLWFGTSEHFSDERQGNASDCQLLWGVDPIVQGRQKSEGLHDMISQRPIRSINKALGWVASAGPVPAGFIVQAAA